MCIDMNLRMDRAALWQCGNVRQYGRQCASVCLVVYGSTCGSVWLSGSAAVCVVVCGNAWLCAAVRAAVCGSVWLYVAVSTVVSAHCAQCTRQYAAVQLVVCIVCGSATVRVWQSGCACLAVRQPVAVRYVQQCTRQCAAVCGSLWQCGSALAAVCGSAHSGVRTVIYEATVPRILMVTDQNELSIRIKVN
jgi:hypothetical protein